MSTLTTSAIRKRTLVRPVRTSEKTPVIQQKTVDAERGIELLNDFIREARKEIRKRGKLLVSGSMIDCDCAQLTFANSQMCITIDFEGGLEL